MPNKWIKEQLARFIENTEDRGQSLNRHFDNYLHRCYKPGRQNTSRPQPLDWESPEIDVAAPATYESYMMKIREKLL